MTEHHLLVLSGFGFLAAGVAIASVLWRWHSPKAKYAQLNVPYVGEFVPAESNGQRFEREKLSAWRAMIRDPDL